MTLAVGGTTLAHKFAATLQSICWEAGDTEESWSAYCDDIFTNTTDMGVEMSLPKVVPVEVPEVFPWAFPRVVDDPETDDEWAPVAAAARRPIRRGRGDGLSLVGTRRGRHWHGETRGPGRLGPS